MKAKRQKHQPISVLDESALSSVQGGEAPTALETTTVGAD